MEKKYYLCYIDEHKAWFTSNWEKQWGDDWNDSPYECNAGDPYNEYYEEGKKYKIDLKCLYFDMPNDGAWGIFPCDRGKWSVEDINKGAVAWIYDEYIDLVIPAKTEINEFIEKIESKGGTIYERRGNI